jgi:protein gp37
VEFVVVGAETGPKRRHCDIEWIRSIVQQCQAGGVQVFVKQIEINGKVEKDIEKFPEDLQVRDLPWKQGDR